MNSFQQIANLLNERFPGVFDFRPGQDGRAKGLEIRRPGRDGFAFVYEPSQNGRFLLSLHDQDVDNNPEVWSASGAEEVVLRLQPWAFPPRWTPPLPIDHEGEKRRLAKIAQGLFARENIPCRSVEPDPTLLRLLTDEGRKHFEADQESLSPELLAFHFPWDQAGRLELNTTVLLDAYQTTAPPGKDRELCLAATGPGRRRDEQSLTISLVDLIVVNQTHRWDRCPWLWKEAEVPPSEFWGADLNADSVAEGPRTGRPRRRFPSTLESRRASESVQLLDEGRIEEALALFGVSLSADLHRLLGGERLKSPACCAHPDAAWTNLLVATLRQSAPWRLPGAVLDEAERIGRWAAQKKSRGRRAPNMKLVIFPGQQHARKASLMLTGDVDGRNPRLLIEATASNARWPDTAWKRPIAVDFLRRGVEFPSLGRQNVRATERATR
jgi:hypothetical protein